jgi:putative DNA methylase
VELAIDAHAEDGWRFQVRTGALSKADEERLKKGTIGRSGGGVCSLSGTSMPFSYIRHEAQTSGLGRRLMALVVDGQRQRAYLSPTEDQVSIADQAKPDWEPQGELPNNPRDFKTPNYGMRTFASLFTPRQLVALTTFSDSIASLRETALADARAAGVRDDPDTLQSGGTGTTAYADAVATYLAFAVSKSSTRSCSLAIWETGMGRLAGAMGRQALPMQWAYAETNPMAGAGGDIAGTAISVAENLQNLGMAGPGSVRNLAAQRNTFSDEAIVISTDPPYYDNIGYADLSDFFYVWLKNSLTAIWPELFRRLTTPKDEELIATPYRHGGREGAEAFFMAGMSEALTAMRKAATSSEPLAIYYAFKQAEAGEDGITSAGWASFLQAVVDAGLNVDGTWPLRTEATNALKANMNALASSVVLVCRKRLADAATVTRADFIRALKREMPAAIDAIRKAGVGPVDMQQSVIGPGMGVFSRHAKVLEDDDSAMSVKTALAVINRVWEEIENELDQAFDAETQVALAWFATYGFDARASGELITLTTAKNTSDRALFASGVFKDMKGKAGLTPREELPPGWTPAGDKTLTTWECVQHTARVLNAPDGGGEAAAALVAQMGPKAEEARALAYRLFEIATNKGWAAEALVYNELAQEWTKLEDRAATLDDTGRAPGPNQAAFTFEGTA